jgi:ADP-ribose pyrophosphatase YjhB (NUDIX family)
LPDKIHLTVATVVEKDGQFLMVKETKGDRQYINQPAGHVEPGEDIIAAALRETHEETGWVVSISGFLGISTFVAESTGVTYYRLTFVAIPLHLDTDATIDPDIDYALWMSIAEIEQNIEHHRSPGVLSCLNDYRENRIFPMEIFRNSLQ